MNQMAQLKWFVPVLEGQDRHDVSSALMSLGHGPLFSWNGGGFEGYADFPRYPANAIVEAIAIVHHPDTDIGATTYATVENHASQTVARYDTREAFERRWALVGGGPVRVETPVPCRMCCFLKEIEGENIG